LQERYVNFCEWAETGSDSFLLDATHSGLVLGFGISWRNDTIPSDVARTKLLLASPIATGKIMPRRMGKSITLMLAGQTIEE
jgi:hypothetical protein